MYCYVLVSIQLRYRYEWMIWSYYFIIIYIIYAITGVLELF
jgi:hypothetical protein